MAIILFGKLSIYFIYPVLIPISRVIKNKTIVLFEGNNFNNIPVTSTGLMFLAELLGGCLYWLTICSISSIHLKKIKRKQVKLDEMREYLTAIPIQKISEKQKRFALIHIFSFFGLAIIELSGSLSFYIFGTAEFNYLMMSVQIVLYALLSYKILRYKVFYHQYLAIVLVILGVILVNMNINTKDIPWYWIILGLLSNASFAILNTCNKKLMQIQYNPLLLLFFAGIFGFGLCILIMLCLYAFCPINRVNAIVCHDLDFYTKANMNDFYYSLIYIFFTSLLNISIAQTNYYFEPTLLVISDVFSSFFDWVINSIDNKIISGMDLGGYIAIIIGALVYNEIVILNFLKLGNYTKLMINQRSKFETDICNYELNYFIENADTSFDMKDFENVNSLNQLNSE